MPLERRLQRLKILNEEEEEVEGDSEGNSSNNLLPLLYEESDALSTNEDLSKVTPSSNPEVTLKSFRHAWKAELNAKSKPAKQDVVAKPGRKTLVDTSLSEEAKLEKASALFLEGADLERRGDMSDAVSRYMAAVRLVPDIEFRISRNKTSTNGENATRSESHGRVRSRSRSLAADGLEEEIFDLEGTLQRRIKDRGSLFDRDISGTACPFTLLPAELLMTVVKYAVGSELDVRCLEMLSMTSAAFYLISRDEELWRTICRRVFGEHRINHADFALGNCWRDAYLSRPHLYHHGVYIAKCTYIRHGEASYQDQFYRPWHIVVYYRFIRFFADGTALMMTSPEKPATIVAQLKSRATRMQGVLFGRYQMVGEDRIVAQFMRHCKRSELPKNRYRRLKQQEFIPHEVASQEFNLELRFGDGKRRSPHCVLLWEKYDCRFGYLNGEMSESTVDVGDHQAFPPLFFSRVKSYAQPEGCDEMLV